MEIIPEQYHMLMKGFDVIVRHSIEQIQEPLELLTGEVYILNEKMQLVMEKLIFGNRNRFGRFFGIGDRRPSDSFHGSRWEHCIFL